MDIKLDSSGDIVVNDDGDISLTDDVRQAVRVRLLWILNEWRLGPDFGFPWFEEVLVKNPNLERIAGDIRSAVSKVDGVERVTSVVYNLDKQTRKVRIGCAFIVDGELLKEEVIMDA